MPVRAGLRGGHAHVSAAGAKELVLEVVGSWQGYSMIQFVCCEPPRACAFNLPFNSTAQSTIFSRIRRTDRGRLRQAHLQSHSLIIRVTEEPAAQMHIHLLPVLAWAVQQTRLGHCALHRGSLFRSPVHAALRFREW